MKTYALSLALVAALAAAAGAAPGAGWANPVGYGGYSAPPAQTVQAQPAAYRGFFNMRGNSAYDGGYNGESYNGNGCTSCGHNGHAGACWDCSNAWDGYCNEAHHSGCAGIWDGFCSEGHRGWCWHHRRVCGHHRGHCGGHLGHHGCGWKRPLFAKSCNTCDTCETTDACDDCNHGCGRLGHCRPLAWFGSMCDKGLHNCRKGWDRCNSCFAGLKGCFGLGGCGCDDACDACGIDGTTSTPVETVLPSTTPGGLEPVPPTPTKDDAPAPGPSA